MAVDAQRDEPVVRGVDQAQPNPLVCHHRNVERGNPVDGEDRRGVLRCVGSRRPCIKDQGDVAIHVRRLGLIDDKRAMQSAVLRRARRRPVPIGPGVRRSEAVVEARARQHRLLGQRCAVECVGQPHAVPVDRGFGWQLIEEANLEFLAALDSQRRPRHHPAVAPDRRHFAFRTAQRNNSGQGAQGAEAVRSRLLRLRGTGK